MDVKRGFLEDKIARGVQLFFSHDLGCAVAAPTRDASGRFGVAHEQASLDGWQVCSVDPETVVQDERACLVLRGLTAVAADYTELH